MQVQVQPAESKHIRILQKIARSSWEAAYQDILSSEQIAYMLDRMYGKEVLEQHLQHPHWRYFLVQEAGAWVGFIGFQTDYLPGVTKLHRLYLVPLRQGRGYGRLLHQAMTDSLPPCQRYLELQVNKFNLKAQRFYAQLGYEKVEEKVLDIGEGFVMDDFILRKKI